MRQRAPQVGLLGAINLQFADDWNRAVGRIRQSWKIREVRVRPPGYSAAVTMRLDSSDFEVFKQIFISRQYLPVTSIKDPKVIVDCGANAGYSALFFLEHFPHARVIAVEPDARNAALCRRNLRRHKDRAVVVEKAVWGTVARLGFVEETRRPGEEWGVQVQPMQETAAPDMVEGIDIPGLMATNGVERIDLLKIDIEKSEAEVFGTNPDAWLRRVGNIAIELHGTECAEIFRSALRNYSFLEEQSGEITACLGLRPRMSEPLAVEDSSEQHPLGQPSVSDPPCFGTGTPRTMTPLVSVVMSVFNGERFLRESVESILNQSFREFEFIIIDDGSTDGTAQILGSYQRSDARIAVYRQENRGLVE